MAVRLPDRETHRREYAALPLRERRGIARAVNRGVAVDDHRHAGHAVILARRQMALWRWLWLTGPLVGLTQLGIGWEQAVATSLLATLTMGAFARWWWTRARRAEQRNLELLERRGSRKKPKAPRPTGGHTPPRPAKRNVPRSKRKKGRR